LTRFAEVQDFCEIAVQYLLGKIRCLGHHIFVGCNLGKISRARNDRSVWKVALFQLKRKLWTAEKNAKKIIWKLVDQNWTSSTICNFYVHILGYVLSNNSPDVLWIRES